MNRKGSVLLHVLVTGTVVALIAASLLRMSMMRFEISARAASGAAKKRAAESAMARIMSYWAEAQTNCVNAAGYSCAGAAGSCSCTCTPAAAGQPTVVAQMAGGRCRVDFVAP